MLIMMNYSEEETSQKKLGPLACNCPQRFVRTLKLLRQRDQWPLKDVGKQIWALNKG